MPNTYICVYVHLQVSRLEQLALSEKQAAQAAYMASVASLAESMAAKAGGGEKKTMDRAAKHEVGRSCIYIYICRDR